MLLCKSCIDNQWMACWLRPAAILVTNISMPQGLFLDLQDHFRDSGNGDEAAEGKQGKTFQRSVGTNTSQIV